MTIHTESHPTDKLGAHQGGRVIYIKASETCFSVRLFDGQNWNDLHLSFDDFYSSLSKLEPTHPMTEVPV